jgi:hypothetical protein
MEGTPMNAAMSTSTDTSKSAAADAVAAPLDLLTDAPGTYVHDH